MSVGPTKAAPMVVVPMTAGHLTRLRLQPAQAVLAPLVAEPGYGAMLAEAGPAFAGLCGDRVVGCAGVVRLTAQRGHAWALLACDAGHSLTAIHRAVVGFLAHQRMRRIETAVDAEFAAGHRWARMLGFECEGLMRAYGPDGRDAHLYARTRD
ncbi:MAG: hypothetical protein R3F55_00235 [Alphaproteobacteria bacterium]